jgi:N,N'-diacetyllegionaminate synthase
MTLDAFPRDRVFIVAEIGNNHEGRFAVAEELVRQAAAAGADAVKFQTSNPDRFVSRADPTRLARLKSFQLSRDQLTSLAALAAREGVVFFSTPLDLDSARFLNGLQSVFKIASGDNNFFPLIAEIAGFGKPMIVSTGLADLPLLSQVERLVVARWGAPDRPPELAFLHCVAGYPVPPAEINLRAIRTLATAFPDRIIGYSDHALGIEAASFAVAAGARILEKHFTLDKAQSDFRDHLLSADPAEFRALVDRVRALEPMLGTGEKALQPCEGPLTVAARRSIAAARDVPAGTTLEVDDLMWVRPGTGLPPGEEARLIGRVTSRAILAGEIIDLSAVRA